MKLKHVKLFEELSPALADRAAKAAWSKVDDYDEESDYGKNPSSNPLDEIKRKKQKNKFNAYVNPEIKSKINDAGFGYFQNIGTHVITWSDGRVDNNAMDANVYVVVYPYKYEIVRGDINLMDEKHQRKLMRVIQYLQEKIK